MKESKSDIGALLKRMGRGALDRMVRASKIPRLTLVAYRTGRRTPPPNKVEDLYKAAASLGADIELTRIERNGVRVVVTAVPELNRAPHWKGPEKWLNSAQPHLAHDARFDVEVHDGVERWYALSRLIAKRPESLAVAVFPRARWDNFNRIGLGLRNS